MCTGGRPISGTYPVCAATCPHSGFLSIRTGRTVAQVWARMAQVSFFPTHLRHCIACMPDSWRRCAHFFRTCAIGLPTCAICALTCTIGSHTCAICALTCTVGLLTCATEGSRLKPGMRESPGMKGRVQTGKDTRTVGEVRADEGVRSGGTVPEREGNPGSCPG